MVKLFTFNIIVIKSLYYIHGRPEGGSWRVSLSPPPNENTNRQLDLFHYSLEGPNFT
jgi:hypothetical protein